MLGRRSGIFLKPRFSEVKPCFFYFYLTCIRDHEDEREYAASQSHLTFNCKPLLIHRSIVVAAVGRRISRDDEDEREYAALQSHFHVSVQAVADPSQYHDDGEKELEVSEGTQTGTAG